MQLILRRSYKKGKTEFKGFSSTHNTPVNFVLPGNTLLHDCQQVVICIPAVDHQRFLHGHGQTQLPLKHLHRKAQKQSKDHDILIFNIQAYAAEEKQSLKLENPFQILPYLFLR